MTEMNIAKTKPRRILKYHLGRPKGVLLLPTDSTVIHVGEQEGELYIWVETPTSDTEWSKLAFLVVATGEAHAGDGRHFKTVQMQNGLVWHIYLNPL